MTENEKRELAELIERGDRYGLMLASVRMWARQSHAECDHAAVYVYHPGDTPPVRITIPASASFGPAR